MPMENVEQYIKELREKLLYHAKLYYVEDAPVISDYEYDRMYAELKALEEAHPEFFDAASPTQRVGGKPLDKFEKVTHTVRMDSLDDVFSFEELKEFLDRVAQTVPDARCKLFGRAEDRRLVGVASIRKRCVDSRRNPWRRRGGRGRDPKSENDFLHSAHPARTAEFDGTW